MAHPGSLRSSYLSVHLTLNQAICYFGNLWGFFAAEYTRSSGLSIPSGDVETVKFYIHYREFLRKSEKNCAKANSSLKNVSDTSYCFSEWDLLQ